jgi:hypothetical protein
MDDLDEAALTAQQKKWFAAIRANLEKDTGRSLAEWVEIARTCPETAHRARMRWFKSEYGLLQNRASYVLGEAFPPTMSWATPEPLREALWKDQAALSILVAVERLTADLEGVVQGQRKGFTAWSRRAQFAALRPLSRGGAMLGLALPPEHDPRLEAARNEGWSERLKARLALASPEEAPPLADLLKAAHAAS